MTPEEPLDDEMFINSNFLANGPIQKAGVKTNMINPVSSASAASQAVAPQNTAQVEATTGYIFRPEGLGSAESEGAGPGVW